MRSYSGPYFPTFGLIQSISPYSVRIRESTDQNNSEYGHFSRSAELNCKKLCNKLETVTNCSIALISSFITVAAVAISFICREEGKVKAITSITNTGHQGIVVDLITTFEL